jgi:N-methylhydantoinase A
LAGAWRPANSAARKRYRIGFDIGGTFTDFAMHDRQSGALHVWKRLTTPADPSVGALAGIDDLLRIAGAAMDEVEQVIHGTTIGANTLIESKGAATALLVTEGFRDLLIMQRPVRYSTYDLWFDKHEPLVPRHLVLPVPERTGSDGEVVRALDEDALRAALASLAPGRIESFAISFLHSYAHPDHERQAGRIVSELFPQATLSLSHAVAPVIGEYERTSTTVVNAYLQPVFARYLDGLREALHERGFHGPVYVCQSNGGLTTAAEVVPLPIRALESGPAAGVSMAAWLGSQHGRHDLVTFDMGGTTAKACFIEAGHIQMERVFDVDQTLMRQGTGLPVVTPSVGLIEIGAGGGSIASVRLGIVEVGPESAGAEPGPACYGRGGHLPTVTDANLVLGYINPDYFLGGRMSLDLQAARRVIETRVAEPLGLDTTAAAWGIHEAVTSNMEHAIRSVSTERGSDPRDLTLVAFGGAGPTHAARLARSLGIREVLYPAAAGIASAVGLLQAAPRMDLTRSLVSALTEPGVAALAAEFAEMDVSVRDMLTSVAPGEPQTLLHRVDMQYAGQGHVIEVSVLPEDEPDMAKALHERFETDYAAIYGYANPGAEPRIVAVKVTGTVAPLKFQLPENKATPAGPVGTRAVFFPEERGFIDCAVYRRVDIAADCAVTGPAVIEDGQCGILLLPGDEAVADAHRNILAHVSTAEALADDGASADSEQRWIP